MCNPARTVEEEAAEEDDAVLHRAQRQVLDALQAAGQHSGAQAGRSACNSTFLQWLARQAGRVFTGLRALLPAKTSANFHPSCPPICLPHLKAIPSMLLANQCLRR